MAKLTDVFTGYIKTKDHINLPNTNYCAKYDTGITKHITKAVDAARYMGTSKPVVSRELTKNTQNLISGRYSIKYKHKEWGSLDNPHVPRRYGKKDIVVRDVITMVEDSYPDLGTAATFMGIAVSTLSIGLSDNAQRVYNSKYQAKRAGQDWVAVTDDSFKRYKSCLRVEVENIQDKTTALYNSVAEAAKDIGVGITTMHYYLKTNQPDKVFKRKYKFKVL